MVTGVEREWFAKHRRKDPLIRLLVLSYGNEVASCPRIRLMKKGIEPFAAMNLSLGRPSSYSTNGENMEIYLHRMAHE